MSWHCEHCGCSFQLSDDLTGSSFLFFFIYTYLEFIFWRVFLGIIPAFSRIFVVLLLSFLYILDTHPLLGLQFIVFPLLQKVSSLCNFLFFRENTYSNFSSFLLFCVFMVILKNIFTQRVLWINYLVFLIIYYMSLKSLIHFKYFPF